MSKTRTREDTKRELRKSRKKDLEEIKRQLEQQTYPDQRESIYPDVLIHNENDLPDYHSTFFFPTTMISASKASSSTIRSVRIFVTCFKKFEGYRTMKAKTYFTSLKMSDCEYNIYLGILPYSLWFSSVFIELKNYGLRAMHPSLVKSSLGRLILYKEIIWAPATEWFRHLIFPVLPALQHLLELGDFLLVRK